MLESWALHLEADRQTSALRTLMSAVQTLFLHQLPPTAHWKYLEKAMKRLAKYTCALPLLTVSWLMSWSLFIGIICSAGTYHEAYECSFECLSHT